MSLKLKAARLGTQGGIPASQYVGEGGILSAFKKVAGAGLSLATGGGIGGAVRALGIGQPRVMPGVGIAAQVPQGPGRAAPMGAPRPGARAFAQRALPFGETGLGEGCPSGYHPNRSSYYTRDGFVEKGTRCVRNRKRNPLNPRALDRGMGRIRSAGKAIRSLGFKAPAVRDIARSRKKRKK